MRKYVDTFEAFSVNENYTQALKYVESLPHKENDYKQQLDTLKTMLVKHPNWILPFSKFRFDDDISFSSLDTLLKDLESKKNLLSLLPMPVIQYESYEKLLDGIIQIERYQVAKKIIDKIPNVQLRQQLLSPAYINKMKDIADLFDKKPANFLQNNFFNKVSAYKTVNDIISALTQLVSNNSVDTIISKAKNAGAEIIFVDQKRKIVVVQVTSYETCKKIGPKAWCIARDEDAYDDYVGYLDYQYIIYSLSLPPEDIKSIVGVTVNARGECTAAHYRNDDEADIEDLQDELNLAIPWDKILKVLSQKEIDDILTTKIPRNINQIIEYGSRDLINHYIKEYFKSGANDGHYTIWGMIKSLYNLSKLDNVFYILQNIDLSDSKKLDTFIDLFITSSGEDDILKPKAIKFIEFIKNNKIDFDSLIENNTVVFDSLTRKIVQHLSDSNRKTLDILNILYNDFGIHSNIFWRNFYDTGAYLYHKEKYTVLFDFIDSKTNQNQATLKENSKIEYVDPYDLVETFKEGKEDNWYMSGGCYEFAEAFGKLLEEKGLKPTYHSFGSEGEPDVHVAIGVNGKFYDASGEYETLGDLSDNGDFYTDTKCGWVNIKAKELPGYGTRDKEIEEIKKDFEKKY